MIRASVRARDRDRVRVKVRARDRIWTVTWTAFREKGMSLILPGTFLPT